MSEHNEDSELEMLRVENARLSDEVTNSYIKIGELEKKTVDLVAKIRELQYDVADANNELINALYPLGSYNEKADFLGILNGCVEAVASGNRREALELYDSVVNVYDAVRRERDFAVISKRRTEINAFLERNK